MKLNIRQSDRWKYKKQKNDGQRRAICGTFKWQKI